MGFGVPSAMGAQLARPDKLVFAICGDGGFQMSIPELATIASHALPIKIVMMNNGYLGMVRQWQTLFYNNRLSAVELDCFPDAEKLASAYGFKGRTIDKPWQLTDALQAKRSTIPARICSTSRYRPKRTFIRWCPPAARSAKWSSARPNRWQWLSLRFCKVGLRPAFIKGTICSKQSPSFSKTNPARCCA